MKVKICGVTRLQDALDACDLGADLLGFNFVPGSARCLDPEKARGIIKGLPPFVGRVGVFAGESVSTVNDMAAELGLTAVQLHGDEDEAYCSLIRPPVIRAVRVGSAMDLKGLEGFDVAAFLLDAKVPGAKGGTGRPFPWDVAQDFSRGHRVFAAGGLGPGNVAAAVRALAPFGVDAASGLEVAPGVKDRVLMERFIAAARGAAAELLKAKGETLEKKRYNAE